MALLWLLLLWATHSVHGSEEDGKCNKVVTYKTPGPQPSSPSYFEPCNDPARCPSRPQRLLDPEGSIVCCHGWKSKPNSEKLICIKDDTGRVPRETSDLASGPHGNRNNLQPTDKSVTEPPAKNVSNATHPTQSTTETVMAVQKSNTAGQPSHPTTIQLLAKDNSKGTADLNVAHLHPISGGLSASETNRTLAISDHNSSISHYGTENTSTTIIPNSKHNDTLKKTGGFSGKIVEPIAHINISIVNAEETITKETTKNNESRCTPSSENNVVTSHPNSVNTLDIDNKSDVKNNQDSTSDLFSPSSASIKTSSSEENKNATTEHSRVTDDIHSTTSRGNLSSTTSQTLVPKNTSEHSLLDKDKKELSTQQVSDIKHIHNSTSDEDSHPTSNAIPTPGNVSSNGHLFPVPVQQQCHSGSSTNNCSLPVDSSTAPPPQQNSSTDNHNTTTNPARNSSATINRNIYVVSKDAPTTISMVKTSATTEALVLTKEDNVSYGSHFETTVVGSNNCSSASGSSKTNCNALHTTDRTPQRSILTVALLLVASVLFIATFLYYWRTRSQRRRANITEENLYFTNPGYGLESTSEQMIMVGSSDTETTGEDHIIDH